MSKPIVRKKFLVRFFAIVVTPVMLLVLPNQFFSWRERSRVSNTFSHVQLPADFNLVDSKWKDRGIDVPSGWVYEYSFNGSYENAFNILENALKDQDFVQPEHNCGNYYGKPFVRTDLCLEINNKGEYLIIYVFERYKV